MNICLEVDKVVIPLDRLIEDELDYQFSKRKALESLGESEKSSPREHLLKQDVKESAKRVQHYYKLKDNVKKYAA